MKAADVNDDDKIELGDAVYLLDYLFFRNVKNLPAPFPDLWRDATEDGLSC